MKLYFDMQIIDEHGTVHGRLRREIHQDAAFIGTRAVDELKAGVLFGGLEQAVELMRVREFRRKLLISAATQCGAALADHLEDREGWHGIERQERIEERYQATTQR
jgi:hypothetical protein